MNQIKQTKPLCIDPETGEKVYDYFNGALEPEEVRRFEQHLVSCLCCEMTILELDSILLTLIEEQDSESALAGGPAEMRVAASRLARKIKP